jgi:Flp pilus assembly protein TadG
MTKPMLTRPRSRGIALILTAVSFLVLGGMLGLGIDVGIMYFLKARLSQAVDAAALAGARSLNRGADPNAQMASAEQTALKFFNANFPTNFWGCTTIAPVNLADVVVTHDPVLKTSFVTITGQVTAPLYFLRLLGFSTTVLAATGQAARRDVNVMLIMDRSSSMADNGAIQPSIDAAKSFVGQFAAGRDMLGMVVFGGDYYLYTPRTDFGPTSADPLVTEIGNINSSGNTNTATALWVAYKALADLNQPGALNVIVFFTDGLPNGITADMIHDINPVTGVATDYRTNPATCGPANDPVTEQPPANVMLGWFAQWSGFAPTGDTAGLYQYVTPVNDGADSPMLGAAASTGCNFKGNAKNLNKDFTQFPDYDYFGTPTWDGAPNKPAYYGAAMNSMQAGNMKAALTSPKKLGDASQNTADFVAQRWRNNPVNGVIPLVYGITLTQAKGEAPDPMFMLRVANDPSGMDNNGQTITNPIYDNTKPTGTYINTAQQDQLQTVFLQIASQILHLTL